MAGSIRASITKLENQNNNSIAPAVPTGIAANDLIFVALRSSATSATTITPPSGFSIVGTKQGGSSGRFDLYVRTATGAESGTFSFGFSTFAHLFATCFVVTGVSTTIAASATNTNSPAFGASVPLTGASVTTGAANQYVVVYASANAGSGTTETVSSYTPASGFTNEYSDADTTFWSYFVRIDDFVDPTNHTTTYSPSATMSGSDNYQAFNGTLVFTPSASGASGSAAITEGADAVSASGTVSVSATAAITEGADTVSAAGTVSVSGTASITEGADSVSASGTVSVSGGASITEGSDTVTASGTATAGVSGSASIIEDPEVVAASGAVAVSGGAALTEGADSVFAIGTANSIVVQTSDPLPIPRRRARRNTDWQSLSQSEIEKLRRIERKLRERRAEPARGARRPKIEDEEEHLIEAPAVAPEPPDRIAPVRAALRASRERAELAADEDDFGELVALEYGERLRVIDALLEIVGMTLR